MMKVVLAFGWREGIGHGSKAGQPVMGLSAELCVWCCLGIETITQHLRHPCWQM